MLRTTATKSEAAMPAYRRARNRRAAAPSVPGIDIGGLHGRLTPIALKRLVAVSMLAINYGPLTISPITAVVKSSDVVDFWSTVEPSSANSLKSVAVCVFLFRHAL